jgi:hypothetical protein
LAGKYSHVAIFQRLINAGANPMIKTRAGTGIRAVSKDERILKMFYLYKAKMYIKAWVANISVLHNNVDENS